MSIPKSHPRNVMSCFSTWCSVAKSFFQGVFFQTSLSPWFLDDFLGLFKVPRTPEETWEIIHKPSINQVDFCWPKRLWPVVQKLVGGLVAIFLIKPIYWVSNHPNWRSYFSEGWPKHQPENVACLISPGNAFMGPPSHWASAQEDGWKHPATHWEAARDSQGARVSFLVREVGEWRNMRHNGYIIYIYNHIYIY